MFTYKGFSLLFDERVYEPAEDTFLLAEHLSSLDISPESKGLEIGVGTGLLSLILAKKCASVVGIDINQHALNLAKKNAEMNGVRNIRFYESDLFENVNGVFDIIVFNTPYVATDGDSEDPAWDGGTTGRIVIDRFLSRVLDFLSANGKIVMVESSLSNYENTLRFFEEKGMTPRVVSRENIHFEEIVCIEAMRN